MTWYEKNVEEQIRPLVKLLRDNGYNTTQSCGHTMYVGCTLYYDDPLLRLFNLLRDNGYVQFKIKVDIEFDGHNHRVLNDFTIYLPLTDGTYHEDAHATWPKEDSPL